MAAQQWQSVLKLAALAYPIVSTMPLPPPLLQPISEAVSVSDIPYDSVGLVLQADKTPIEPQPMQGGQRLTEEHVEQMTDSECLWEFQ
jgi:hypothetical protein